MFHGTLLRMFEFLYTDHDLGCLYIILNRIKALLNEILFKTKPTYSITPNTV